MRDTASATENNRPDLQTVFLLCKNYRLFFGTRVKTWCKRPRYCRVTGSAGKPHGLKDHVYPGDENHLVARQARKVPGGVGR